MKTSAADGKRRSVKLEAPPPGQGQTTRPPGGQPGAPSSPPSKEGEASPGPSSSVQPASTLYDKGDVVHITRYRRQRNVQRGGPTLNLDQGVVKERKFTDPIFVLFFVFTIAAMCFIASRSFSKGDPWTLLYGADTFGNTCRMVKPKVPNVTLSGLNLEKFKKVFFMADGIHLCVTQCLDKIIVTPAQMIAHRRNESVNFCLYNVTEKMMIDYYGNRTNIAAGELLCPKLPLFPQKSVFNRCLLDASKLSDAALKKYGNLTHEVDCTKRQEFFMTVATDIDVCITDLIYLCVIGIVLSSAVLLFLAFLTKIAVWVVFISPLLISFGAVVFCWRKYGLLAAQESEISAGDSPVMWAVLGSICIVLLIIVTVVLLLLRKKVNLVIPVFSEAGNSLRSIPMLLVLPFLVVIILTLVVLLFIWLFLYMQSAYNYTATPLETASKNLDSLIKFLRYIYIVCLIWVVKVFFGCEKYIVISAVADWYFSRSKDIFENGVSRSTNRLFTRHLGSVLLGSLVLNIFLDMYQWLMKSIQKKAAKSRSSFTLCLNDCCACCLHCYEKCLKYLDSSAYAMIAIYGCTFCEGCRKSYAVSAGVGKELEYVCFVAGLIIFLGKIGSMALQFIIAFNLIDRNPEVCINIFPILIAVLWIILVIHVFLVPFTGSMECLFICYCEDITRNDGEVSPYFMSEQLKEFLVRDKEKQAQELKEREELGAAGEELKNTNKQTSPPKGLPQSSTPDTSPDSRTRY